jgi:GNAT superfamily N-acetyltransferase
MTIVTELDQRNIEALAKLVEEMDRFYGATEFESLDSRIRQIGDALFGDLPSAHVIIAWIDQQLVGFASYSFLWPAVGLTRSLFLKELYVAQATRRIGVGRLLMGRINQIAIESQCSRVEWMTDLFNSDAQVFYDQLDVSVNKSKLFYRVQGDEIRRQAGEWR